MAKVSNRNVYIPKEFLSLKDYFVITDSENFKRTKTVESKHVLNFINKYSGNPNSIFIYSNIQDEDFNLQTEGYFFSEGNEENPEQASKLYFNFKNIFGEYITPLFQVIVESGVVAIKMINTNDSDNFVYIKPSEILVYEDYFEFDSEVISNLCSGNFVNGNHYVLHFELYGGANSDQDNIKKEILIDCPAEITPTAFAATINALAAFSISDKEIPTFKAVSIGAEPVTYYVELLNIGKGDYGTEQTQLEASNIKVTSFGITTFDIEELPSTQVIELGTSASNIVDTINNQDPAITIQDQNDGYVIIKGIFEGVYHEYLWLGAGGVYGLGELQAVDSDLKELNTVAPTVDKATPTYSGTVKTNSYSADPVVYLKEEVDAANAIQDNRISDLEFPDIVLETGTIVLDGLELDADGYKWRLNQIDFLSPAAYNTTLVAATDNYFRYDLLQGDSTGAYSIKQGIEGETSADVPTADVGKIALAVVAIEGDTVIAITPPDLTSIEARLADLENRVPVPSNGFTGEANAIWTGSGLSYHIITSTYYLNGILYPAINTTFGSPLTLDAADDDNPRFDSIIADVNGSNKETGIAEENPAAPTLNPNTQLLITNVLINAGATVPANTSQNLIYDEGTEWDPYASNGAIAFNNTSSPLNGTYCINVSNSINNSYFELTAPDTQNIVDADGFKIWTKLTSAIVANRGFNIAFYNGATRVSNIISFVRANGSSGSVGLYGFQFTNTTNYQLTVIPFQDFGFTASTYNKVRITFISTISAKFDYLALITSGGGLGTPSDKKGISKIITNNGMASATTPEDSITVIGSNGIETSASGKVITVSGKNLDTLWHKLAWANAGNVSLSGTTATSSAGVFESDMVGAKIAIGNYDFIISSYSSPTSVQVASNPYGTVTGPNGSWGVYNKAVEITDTGYLNLYGTSSPVPASIYSESAMILPNLVTTIGSLIGISANSIQMTSGVPLVWRSGDLATDATRDVGIKRNAAGVLEIFDGITAGEYRDMVVRNISGVTATDPAHYVPLAQMEAADADVLADANAYTDTVAVDKVDKDGAKVLSDNNYSNGDKDKVSYITITQAVNLDDIETRVNDLDAAVVLKGTWDQTSGVFPGSGVAQAGWSYLVTGATTTVDGIEFNDGDRIIAVIDNASTTTYAGNWYKADYTDKVNTVAGRTGNVVITSSDLSDFNSSVNALIATAISGKEDTSNKTDVMSGNTTSSTKYLSAKGVYDWATGLFQAILVSGTNIKTINSSSILGSGNLVLNTVPVNIKYLSQQGCISDADLSYGSSTFGTDNTSIIQGVLNTASVSNPLTIYWDGKYSVTGLLVKSYTTIIVDNGCGAILRDNSDKAILSNYNAIPVSSPGTFADNNITIIGGIWNGNGYRGGVAKQMHSNSTYGFVTGIRMYGVKDVILENLNIINTRTYACLFFTNENIIVNNMTIYQGVTTYVNQDGLDFDGYQKNIRVNGLKAKCGDDALAINTSMLKNGVDPGDYTIYLGKYGPATNIDIQNLFFDGSQMGIRLLSGNQLIDNITIRNVKGICEAYWLIIDNYLQNTAGLDDVGPGNVGKVLIENINVTNLSGTAYSGNFAKGSVNCNVESLTLRNYMRNDFVVNNNPSFMVKGVNTIVKLLNIEDYYSFDSSTTNTISHFVIDGATVWNINISGYCERNAISNDSPLVKLINSAHVDKLVLNEVTLLGSNNLLDNSAYLNYIRAYGVHHKATDNTTPTFKTTTTINDIVLSNYYGFNRTSGTFTTSRGDGFLDILPGTPTPPWSLLLTSLKAYWKLDEASGNAVDSSGNSYSLVNTNTVSYVSGKINNGISFNGTSNYLTATLVSALPKISINVWVNLSTFSGIQMLYSNEERSSSKYGVSLYTNGSVVGNQLVFSIGNGATHVDRTIAQTLTVNTWYMVTFTFDSNALKVYIDGVQKDSATLGFSSIGSNTSNRFRLGAEAGATPLYYCSGKLDEFGIWERLLSPTEITSLYNSGSGVQHPF